VLPVQGNLYPSSIVIGNIDNDPSQDNEIAVATIEGELSIFKGLHYLYTGAANDEIAVIENPTIPDLMPWAKATGLGTITCLSLAPIRPRPRILRRNMPEPSTDPSYSQHTARPATSCQSLDEMIADLHSKFLSLLVLNAEGQLYVFDIDADKFALYQSGYLKRAIARMQLQPQWNTPEFYQMLHRYLDKADSLRRDIVPRRHGDDATDGLLCTHSRDSPYAEGATIAAEYDDCFNRSIASITSASLEAMAERKSRKRSLFKKIDQQLVTHTLSPTKTFKVPFDGHYVISADLDSDGWCELYLVTAAPSLHIFKFHYTSSTPPAEPPVIRRTLAKTKSVSQGADTALQPGRSLSLIPAQQQSRPSHKGKGEGHQQDELKSVCGTPIIPPNRSEDGDYDELASEHSQRTASVEDQPKIPPPSLRGDTSHRDGTSTLRSSEANAAGVTAFMDEDEDEDEDDGSDEMDDEDLEVPEAEELLRPPALASWLPSELVPITAPFSLPGAVISMTAASVSPTTPILRGFHFIQDENGKVPVLYLGTEAGAYIAFWTKCSKQGDERQHELVLRMITPMDAASSGASEEPTKDSPPPALCVPSSTFAKRTFVTAASNQADDSVVVCSGVGQLAVLDLARGVDIASKSLEDLKQADSSEPTRDLPQQDGASQSVLSHLKLTPSTFTHRLPAVSVWPLGGRIMQVTALQSLWDPSFEPHSQSAPPLSLPRITPALREPQVVVCRWDGVTFFGPKAPFFEQPQLVETQDSLLSTKWELISPSPGIGGARRQLLLRFQFGERIRAFAAGNFTLVPGVTMPAFCYVTFRGTLVIVLLEHLDCRLASGGHTSLSAADAFVDAVVAGEYQIPKREKLVDLKFGSEAISFVNDLAYDPKAAQQSTGPPSQQAGSEKKRKSKAESKSSEQLELDAEAETETGAGLASIAEQSAPADHDTEKDSVPVTARQLRASEVVMSQPEATETAPRSTDLSPNELKSTGLFGKELSDFLSEYKSTSTLPLTSADSQEELELIIRQQAEVVRLAKATKTDSAALKEAIDLLLYFKLQSTNEQHRASALNELKHREKRVTVQEPQAQKAAVQQSAQQAAQVTQAQKQLKSHPAKSQSQKQPAHKQAAAKHRQAQLPDMHPADSIDDLDDGFDTGDTGAGSMPGSGDAVDDAIRSSGAQLLVRSTGNQVELRLVGVHGQLRMRPDEYLWLRPGLIDASDDLVAWLAASQRYSPILREANLWAASPQLSGPTVARMLLSLLGVENEVLIALNCHRKALLTDTRAIQPKMRTSKLPQDLLCNLKCLAPRLPVIKALTKISANPKASALMTLQQALLCGDSHVLADSIGSASELPPSVDEEAKRHAALQDATETLPLDYLLSLQEHPARHEAARAVRHVRRADPASLLAYRDALALLVRARIDERAVKRQARKLRKKATGIPNATMNTTPDLDLGIRDEQWHREQDALAQVFSPHKISTSPVALLAPTAALTTMREQSQARNESWTPFQTRPFLPTAALDPNRDIAVARALDRLERYSTDRKVTRRARRKQQMQLQSQETTDADSVIM